MAKERTVKGRLGSLLQLLARLNGNREELQHLEASRTRFEAMLAQLQEAADRQAVHTAAKQEASQQLQTILTEVERLATVLRFAVKQHYGIRAEKLAEFGMQPFRGRTRTAQTEEPESPSPSPEEPKPAIGEAT
jgi:chromosome segregation ATPase